jgi:hypothetical protein
MDSCVGQWSSVSERSRRSEINFFSCSRELNKELEKEKQEPEVKDQQCSRARHRRGEVVLSAATVRGRGGSYVT